MMKKIIKMLLLFIILSIMFSCSDNNDTNTKENGENFETTMSDQIEENTFYGLEIQNFEGKVFNILYRGDQDYAADYSIYVESDTGEIVDSAVYKRNRSVEETYNIKINAIAINGNWENRDNFNNTVINSVYAGDGAFDLIDYYAGYVCDAISANILLALNEIDSINLESPWWSQIAAEKLNVNGKIFTIPGDLSLNLWSHILTIFFNKTVLNDYNINEDIYKLVNDGNWTVEKFNAISRIIYIDIDGNGEYNINDAYGVAFVDDLQFNNFHYALNIPITTKDSDGFIKLNTDSNEVDNMISYLYAMIYETDGVKFFQGKENDVNLMFQENRLLFMPTLLGNAEKLRDMDSDFGIIPYPKSSEEQSFYGTTSRDQHTLFCIPIDVKDIDFAGIITEALCVASYHEVVPIYYDIVLKNKYTRDDDSALMLDLIREGLSFDFGAVYSLSLERAGYFVRDVLYQKKTDSASYFAANSEKYYSSLETFLECFK